MKVEGNERDVVVGMIETIGESHFRRILPDGKFSTFASAIDGAVSFMVDELAQQSNDVEERTIETTLGAMLGYAMLQGVVALLAGSPQVDDQVMFEMQRDNAWKGVLKTFKDRAELASAESP